MNRTRPLVIAVLGGVAAFGVFGGFSTLGGRAGTSDPYDAIPKGSFIAATVDFAELRRSPIYDVLGGRENGDPLKKAIGVSALGDACGFDPTSRVDKLAVAIPEDDTERGAFGVVAKVEVTRDELEKCTKALADKRGGKTETKDVGTFVVLDDKSIGGSLAPRIAYGRAGLLVVSKGAWFDSILAAADHKQPSLKNALEHASLRQTLTSREGFRAPTLVLTAILPKALRERLKNDMADEPGDASMTGVLGVSAVGVAIHAGGAGQNVDAEIELVCDDEASCASVEKLVQKKKKELAGELTLRMVGLGPLLDSFQVKQEGAHLRATTTAQADALAATIERILKLRQGGQAPGGQRRAPVPRRPPEEIIPARPDAGKQP